MLPRPGWSCKSGLAGIVVLALSCSDAPAQDPSESPTAGRGSYVSIFGGGGVSSINGVTQIGNALFPPEKGGPLDVIATGNSRNRGVGLVGLQLGHYFSGGPADGGWGLRPAGELEGFYFAGVQRALVTNPTTRLLPFAHQFDDSFPMNNAVFMTNLVLNFQTPNRSLIPYIGGGIGAAAITIHGANSPQVSPPEPGVNHFNSGTDSSSWGFAAQAKVGIRYQLTEWAYVFSEYRFLYVGSTSYVFGSTVFPGHAPTTPWTVRFGDMTNHLAVGGVGFNF